ncbi:MAG: hypothetical protein HDQ96_12490 [Lachnospiraceae bacterium]|nr:hypothetical protein [Lachnospiraceae bacterium]
MSPEVHKTIKRSKASRYITICETDSDGSRYIAAGNLSSAIVYGNGANASLKAMHHGTGIGV